MKIQRVLVVGAGPAGLAVSRALRDAGLEVVGVERHTDVGGIWDIDNPGSPMYRSAHFISSRTLSALDGLALPDDLPDYPRHDQLLAYLRAYAETFGLYPLYRFGVAVEGLAPLGVEGDGWRATLSNGETLGVDAVVLASGSQWTGFTPEIPGAFAGDQLHSQAYREASSFAGQRVLVVGAGNSGCDIASDLVGTAESVDISVRRGYRFVPKYILGQPADVFAHRGPSLPPALQQKAFNVLLDRLVGKPESYGFPKPDHDVLSTHPIMNTQVLHHAAHGDLQPRPDVASLAGDRVQFVDGTGASYDAVIWATGYRLAFAYLDDDVLTWRRENDPALLLNVFSADRLDIAVAGLVETDGGAWPILAKQARAIAAVFTSIATVAERAASFKALASERLDLEGGVAHIDSARHRYYTQHDVVHRYWDRLLASIEQGAVPGSLERGFKARARRARSQA